MEHVAWLQSWVLFCSVPWFLPFLVSYSYLMQVPNNHKISATCNKKCCFLLFYQLVVWRYRFQAAVRELAGVTLVHKLFIIWGPAHYSKNAPSMREVGSPQQWVETQMPLKAIVTLSLSPTPHCPKHTTWLNLSLSWLNHISPIEVDGRQEINIYWMMNLTYNTSPFRSLVSSFPTGSMSLTISF